MNKRLMLSSLAAVAVLLPATVAAWPWSKTTSVDGAGYNKVLGWPHISAAHIDMSGGGKSWSCDTWYWLGSFSFNNVPVKTNYHFKVKYTSGAVKEFDRYIGQPAASSWDVGNLW